MPPPPLEFEDSSSALAVPPYSDCPGTAARVEKDDTFCAAAAPPRDLDTWLLYGRRYDLREFLSSHPGGDLALLLGRGGTDATALFEQYHQRASAPRAALAARPWHDASGKSHDPAPLPTSSAPGSAGEAFHSELRAALEARYTASSIEIGFNSRYLLEILGQIEGDAARFTMADAASPTVIRDVADASAMYVLMPMRV